MRIWTLVKLLAGVAVLAVIAFSGMLAYHVAVKPLDGVFSRLIPPVTKAAPGSTDEDLVRMLDADEMPDIDPGEKSYQKAQELLALGKLAEAREKLAAIVNIYPSSSSAPAARRIVGEINLDEMLSASHMEGKKTHVVKRGDSILAIASQNQTTIENMMHINSLLELRGIQPGDEFVVMPLNFHILIEPKRKSLSIWDGGKFVKEYQILHLPQAAYPAQRGKISQRTAELDGKKLAPQSKFYAFAAKVIQVSKPVVQIRSWDGDGEKPPGAILLKPQDMEELSLLTRAGNGVEFR